jgi:hypothetical protein
MNINIRMEGGLGDHLLANRFAPAILDKHPSAKIKIFSDTEGNNRSLNALLDLFPDFYIRGGEVIQERSNKTYPISTQFGIENYPAHIDNQKLEILNRMMDCDKFYDLHIDGLHWLNYDYDWLRYFYFFPKPHKEFSPIYDFKYIMTHLYSRPDSAYNLDKHYVIRLLQEISKIDKVVVITEEQYKNYYEDIFNNSNIIINTTNNLSELFAIASGCSSFIGIDSGIRYIPYHFSKPTFVFSKYCYEYGNVAYSHLIRWLIFNKSVFPISISVDTVSKILYNIHTDKTYGLFPEILTDINQYIVKRF